MSTHGVQQFNKSELHNLMKEQGAEAASEKQKEPVSVRTRVLQVLMGVVAALYFALLFFGKLFLPADSEFLLSLDVFSSAEKPNRLVYIISLVILTLTISKVLCFFIGRLKYNKSLTKRTGVAVIELFANMTKYVSVLVLVFLILGAMGVDTAELLAGLGILSLVLGLGVTSLVEDVVAGIFIIAEKLFDVGDIVVVDDFRGKIVSIGMRSTQIEDEGGDILILRNSSIQSLVNMTNRASYAICDIPISPMEPFTRVEQVIQNAHLETLKEQYPEIESGPFYLGLSEITEGGVRLITFVATCPENRKYAIQRILNRELNLLFEENNIRLGEAGDDDE